jgi:integrase
MSKPPLTAVEIAELSEGANTEFPDGLYWAGPHLYVQIRGASASWVFRWYVGPRVFTLGLGGLQTVGKGAAERLRDKYLAMVKDGADPRVVHKALKRAAGASGIPSPAAIAAPPSTVPTFKAAARDYIDKNEHRVKSTDKWWRLLKGHAFPVIEAVPVDQVTTDHMLAILQPIWHDHQPTAGPLRSLLRKILAWAKAHGWRDGDNPANDESLVIKLGGTVRHEESSYKAISYRDAPALWKALEAQGDVIADLIMWQMLTGVRPSEARCARWSEVDFQARVWAIPTDRMKMNRVHRVPLSTQAMAILEKRRALAGDGAIHLFPSAHRKGQPLDRSTMRERIQRLGFDGTAHGLRSTLTDWFTDVLKLDVDIQEKALAHVEKSRTRGAYARSDRLDARAEPMQAWADYVTGSVAQTAG